MYHVYNSLPSNAMNSRNVLRIHYRSTVILVGAFSNKKSSWSANETILINQQCMDVWMTLRKGEGEDKEFTVMSIIKFKYKIKKLTWKQLYQQNRTISFYWPYPIKFKAMKDVKESRFQHHFQNAAPSTLKISLLRVKKWHYWNILEYQLTLLPIPFQPLWLKDFKTLCSTSFRLHY